jgi:hypothetical protein
MFDVTKHIYICMGISRVHCSLLDYVLPTVGPLKSTPAVGKASVEVINNNYIIDWHKASLAQPPLRRQICNSSLYFEET